MAKALEHIRVLDLGQFEAGPTCGLLLALLGAEVIKIEPPGKGDPARYAAPGVPSDADSFYFIYLNLSKKSITLDLEKPKGAEIFKEMVKRADIVIENFAPGTMEKLGLGYDVLKQINSKLIMGTIRPFGTGPYGSYPATDLIAEAMGGTSNITGFANKPPVRPGPNVGEAGAAVFLSGAILAALHQRRRTGKGQLVEIATADAVHAIMRVMGGSQTERDQMFQKEPNPRAQLVMPLRTKDSKTKDNYIIILPAMPHHIAALLKVIGREDLLADERFKNFMNIIYDPKVSKAWNETIEAWTSQRDAYDAFHSIAKARVPVGITLNTTQIMNDPNFVTRKSVVELEHPVRGRFKTVTTPCRLAKSPPDVRSAPLLGEHNEEIYAKLMGYTKEDVAKLKGVGVI